MTYTEQSLLDLIAEPPADPHETAWRWFIRDHPHVWDLIIAQAEAAKARGERRDSTKRIFEAIRKYVPRDGEPVALNNNWTAPCARMIIERRPDLAPMYRTRQRRAA